jgi:hypothetical protein
MSNVPENSNGFDPFEFCLLKAPKKVYKGKKGKSLN